MKGISVKPAIGLGDGLQFSSLPENYFRATGEKLVDVSRSWFFDHNPYVVRDAVPDSVQEMWNFGPQQYEWVSPRKEDVYLSNAEIHATVLRVPVVLNRPRLYRFEEFNFSLRTKILLHLDGKSNGPMPDHVIKHILKKYGDRYTDTYDLCTIGNMKIDGIKHIDTPTLWDLAEVISEARMLIGLDSGPAWVAACYPDVIVKKLRMKPRPEYLKDWVPLSVKNLHTHWDDRCHQVFNPTESDIGFTNSYRNI